EQQRSEAARLVPESSLTGALFPRPLLSPVFLGQPLSMDFNFVGVHPGRYDLLLRVKKLLCDPLDSESVASAADSSGVRVPLLQARCILINYSSLLNQPLLSASTVSHLLQNYSMQPDRWFYWRLAVLDLPSDGLGVLDLTARVSIMRRGVADATVTQEEFERELRNALLVDHLFLRLQPCPDPCY
uniref:WS_DGAT_C domain-containing protein n=1 Tax=Macrostomum lignano TaxID=282301 RepID=A0A1I8FAB4_9PLAT